MKTVRVNVLPVLCGLDMRESIGVIVHDHLGITGRSGREIKQMQIVCFCGDTLKNVRILFDLAVEFMPALVRAVHYRFYAQSAVAEKFVCFINVVGDFGVSGGDHAGYVGRLEAIMEILCCEHMGSRDRYSANLHQSDYRVPVLIVSLQHQHHLVAFLYAPAAEHISRAVGEL